MLNKLFFRHILHTTVAEIGSCVTLSVVALYLFWVCKHLLIWYLTREYALFNARKRVHFE